MSKLNILFETILNRLLLEANPGRRIEYLTKKFPDLDPTIISTIVHEDDPTQGEYSEWIVRRYLKLNDAAKKRYETEDSYKVKAALTSYHKYKRHFKDWQGGNVITHRGTEIKVAPLTDINRIPDFDALYDLHAQVLVPFEQDDAKAEIETAASSKINRIFESDDWIIVQPLTQEASCKYGAGTRWCTAATDSYNAFSSYHKQGPLYILIHKVDQDKYQFHFQSEQYMNSDDREIGLKSFFENHPELKEIMIELAKENNSVHIIKYIDFEKYVNTGVEIIENTESSDKYSLMETDPNIVLAYGIKQPEDANKRQTLFHFSEEGISIQTPGFDELVDFIGGSRRSYEREYAKKLLSDDYFDSEQNSDTWVQYDEDIWDYLDQSNFSKISDYLISIKDDYEMEEELDLYTMKDAITFVEENDISEVKDALTRAYYDIHDSASADEQRKAAMSPILSVFGKKYEYIDEKHATLRFEASPVKWVQGLIDTVNNSDDGSDGLTCNTFISSLAASLEASDDLETPDFDRANNNGYPTKEEHGDLFNDSFDNHFDP